MIGPAIQHSRYKIPLTIRENSVSNCVRINMKLETSFVVFVLGVMGVFEMVDSMCLIKNTSEPRTYGFQCSMSNNYLSDVNEAPVDIFRLMFTSSEITQVHNGSFLRLGKSLMVLSVVNCGVEIIEENAFEGLTKLEVLDFRSNRLEMIKAAWFKGLTSLCVVTFKRNRVKHIEDGFFTGIPPYMDFLDLSENELTCLPAIALTGGFRVHSLHIKHNPLTWSCQTLLMNWFENTEFEIEHHGRPHHIDTVGQPYDLAAICAEKLSSKLQPNEEFLINCAEETTRKFLPEGENYTVKQVCEFLKDKPSPFLNCTE